jgi:hypothetical protein
MTAASAIFFRPQIKRQLFTNLKSPFAQHNEQKGSQRITRSFRYFRKNLEYLAIIYFHKKLRYGIEVSQINQATDNLFSLQLSQVCITES